MDKLQSCGPLQVDPVVNTQLCNKVIHALNPLCKEEVQEILVQLILVATSKTALPLPPRGD